MQFTDITYSTEGRIATITLDRPERLNAISMAMPGEIAAAVERANRDDSVHVIVLTGAGRAFCSGYDLVDFAEAEGEKPGSQLGDGQDDLRQGFQKYFGLNSILLTEFTLRLCGATVYTIVYTCQGVLVATFGDFPKLAGTALVGQVSPPLLEGLYHGYQVAA